MRISDWSSDVCSSDLPAAQAAMSVEGFALLVVLGMAGGLVLLTLGMRFLQTMLEIIRSVGKGDPFVSANAARLRAMAWLLLAIQLGGLALGRYGHWLGKFFDGSAEGLVGKECARTCRSRGAPDN